MDSRTTLEELIKILTQRGLYEERISLAEVLQRMDIYEFTELDLSDETVLAKFIETYNNVKIEKEYEEPEISEYQFMNSKPKSEEIIEIPNIDEILKKESKKQDFINDLVDFSWGKQNHKEEKIIQINEAEEENEKSSNDVIPTKNQHVIFEITDDREGLEDLFKDDFPPKKIENKKKTIIEEEKASNLKNQHAIVQINDDIEGLENLFKDDFPSKNIENKKKTILEEEKAQNQEVMQPFVSEKTSLLQEEVKSSHILDIASEEESDLCRVHQWSSEFFCPNHCVFLCKICVEELKKQHGACQLINSKNIDKNLIIYEILQQIQNFRSETYKSTEKLLEVLCGLEVKQPQLSFELIITTIKDVNVVENINKYLEKKEFILEIAQIIFEKYLTSIIKIYNDRTLILEKTKNLERSAEIDLQNWLISIENTEKIEIFKGFLKKKQDFIKLRNEVLSHRKINDSIMNHSKEKVIDDIFKTIILHLTKLYSKLDENE